MISLTYEELLNDSHLVGLIVKEKYIPGYGGRIYKNRVAIHSGLNTSTEKACVLAEELGHYYTSYGNILNQTSLDNRKQEFRARVWAYQKIITMDKLISAYQKGCRNSYEIAQELDVTEEFLLEGISVFKQKYPSVVQYKGFLIQFNPILDIYRYSD